MEEKLEFGANRLVHLDLKRAPLKVDFMEKIFPFFREWGATGLLIEWEDTFPYSDSLECIGSLNVESKAYSVADIERILKLAENSNLSVIPLVQTFGHLEFVLRHEEWKQLREVWKYTNALCPSNPKSLSLVTSMIDQVISKMPKDLQYFHIGADEVWQLGSCSFCSSQDKHVVLLEHLVSVLKHFKENYPHIRPIMWDDMIRGVPASLIQAHSLSELVDIMVWFYEPAPFFNIPIDLWNKYATIFKKVWIASAYKGATGACQILPVIQHHVSNHEQWLAFIKSSRAEIKGIAITGWSRYDHFATLCELLPSALPCLAICLSICKENEYTEEIFKKVATSLGYDQVPLLTNPYPRPQAVAPDLNYPGWKITTGVEWLANLKGKHMAIISSDQVGAWMNSWQLSTGFINPMQIQGIVSTLFNIGEEWEALETYMRDHMSEAYYQPQIEEWIATHCKPLKGKAKELYKSGHDLISAQLGTESLQMPTQFFPTPRPI
ncbi:unnamed protein product [Nezara viridula]|uniref:beta-N-acetylhexosaminidase n=1 Tax=Nezara viridula TaxID=85310 RepID=A0A9P0H5P8_NEZVI|nr:unnamed protein product [Nezara viridula]